MKHMIVRYQTKPEATAENQRLIENVFTELRAAAPDGIRLELVNRSRRSGRQAVTTYFGNYDGLADWRLVPGLVDRRPAVLVLDPTAAPAYFVLLEWIGDQLSGIRDFRYARYVTDGAELIVMR
jgi:RNA polymerase sigma-70 factor, ECF subfamily